MRGEVDELRSFPLRDRTGWQCSWSSVEGHILLTVVWLPEVRHLRISNRRNVRISLLRIGLDDRAFCDWLYCDNENRKMLIRLCCFGCIYPYSTLQIIKAQSQKLQYVVPGSGGLVWHSHSHSTGGIGECEGAGGARDGESLRKILQQIKSFWYKVFREARFIELLLSLIMFFHE